ncbi:hypothetical protein DFR50_114109 [Roseiarcus fermentans]|uniref:N-acetyltransferase domain-containing protein n=1 Tax=Roseiarcus fermentans TaxID=1473586 RepID=A0A366FEX1_9HYPH|nr:GNAT family N-acetyltransferase [Roseiarcus fermentans]RBP12279.1 hypothetical protein DFR50_114109 [Roseiarcus fermentans]
MNGDDTDVREVDRRDASRASSALLALNNAHAEALSRLSADALTGLMASAFLTLRAGDCDAFLIALDQDAGYDSPNFLWFRARFERFVYVDRVAVAPHARGRGLARTLYQALFRRARAAGHERIVAEVNADPPNPASDAFHAAMGFVVVGSARLTNGKAVRYHERALGEARD